MVLMQYSREHPDAQMAAQILALEETAWPSDGENAPFPSAPETYVTSFVLLDEGRAICHVGIHRAPLAISIRNFRLRPFCPLHAMANLLPFCGNAGKKHREIGE